MHLFLSLSFLARLQILWRKNLHAFLIGRRNLYFFTPDHLVETEKIDAETINQLLEKLAEIEDWELLGFVSPSPVEPHSGYVQVVTGDDENPQTWIAELYLPAGPELVPGKVEILLGEK